LATTYGVYAEANGLNDLVRKFVNRKEVPAVEQPKTVESSLLAQFHQFKEQTPKKQHILLESKSARRSAARLTYAERVKKIRNKSR